MFVSCARAGIQASKIRWLSTPALGHVAPPASIEQPAAEPSKVKVPKPRKGEPGYCPPRRSITGQTLFERELVLPHAGGAIGANRVWMREQWELLDEEVQEAWMDLAADGEGLESKEAAWLAALVARIPKMPQALKPKQLFIEEYNARLISEAAETDKEKVKKDISSGKYDWKRSKAYTKLNPGQKEEYAKRVHASKLAYNDAIKTFDSTLTRRELRMIREAKIRRPAIKMPGWRSPQKSPFLDFLKEFRAANPPSTEGLKPMEIKAAWNKVTADGARAWEAHKALLQRKNEPAPSATAAEGQPSTTDGVSGGAASKEAKAADPSEGQQ